MTRIRETSEILPKSGWWKLGDMEQFVDVIVRVRKALASLDRTMLGRIPWTHSIVVKSDDISQPEDFWCGDAACVEMVKVFGTLQRFAVFWTGDRHPNNIRFGKVPPEFVLVPSQEFLGNILLHTIVSLGYERVEKTTKRPAKNQFWLNYHGQYAVAARFHTVRSFRRVDRQLKQIPISYETTDDLDIVVWPRDNVLR